MKIVAKKMKTRMRKHLQQLLPQQLKNRLQNAQYQTIFTTNVPLLPPPHIHQNPQHKNHPISQKPKDPTPMNTT